MDAVRGRLGGCHHCWTDTSIMQEVQGFQTHASSRRGWRRIPSTALSVPTVGAGRVVALIFPQPTVRALPLLVSSVAPVLAAGVEV